MTLIAGGSPTAATTTGQQPPQVPRRDEEVPDSIPRDQWRRPLIVPAKGGKAKAYTRASTLGGTLEDTYGLDQWRKRMVTYGIGRRRDLQLAAGAVRDPNSDTGRETLKKLAEQALEAAETSARATIGTALHSYTESIDAGEPIPDVGEFTPVLQAYARMIAPFHIHGREVFTACDRWQVAGTFDHLLSPRHPMTAPDGTVFGPDDRLIGDLKTSGSADYFGIKFAVQLACYAYGHPYDTNGWWEWPDMVAPSESWALILHVPSDPAKVADAGLYWVDLTRGAELADLACTVRDARSSAKRLCAAAEAPREPVPSPPAPVKDDEIDDPIAWCDCRPSEHCDGPRCRNDTGIPAPIELDEREHLLSLLVEAKDTDTLDDLWEAHGKTIWTDAHTTAAQQRWTELAAVGS